MALHETTFEYLKPSDRQTEIMGLMRGHANTYAQQIEHYMPEGPDKTYALRKLREIAMWVNTGITRMPDGKPRPDPQPQP